MADMDKSIERVLAVYASAALAKDVDAFLQLYDPAVRVFDTWGLWSHEGADAWRIAVEGWFGSLGAERVRVTFDEVRVASGRELTLVTAFVRYTALSPTAEPLRSIDNRITWALKSSGHQWRIVHEHTSAPMGFDDRKAILRRGTQGA